MLKILVGQIFMENNSARADEFRKIQHFKIEQELAEL